MRDTKTNLKYITKRSSLVDRITNLGTEMDVIDFMISTDNPYIAPVAQYTVFYKGNLKGADNVLTRLQSACVLGRIWGFDNCDCQSQLLTSFNLLEKEQNGLIIYCNDDHGKGTGLWNHAKTLIVEKFKGLDEDSARAYLGLEDKRDYKPAVVIINHFGVKSIKLLTNNVSKLDVFRQYSIPAEKVGLTTWRDKY